MSVHLAIKGRFTFPSPAAAKQRFTFLEESWSEEPLAWGTFTRKGSSIDFDFDNFMGGDTDDTMRSALAAVAGDAIAGSVSFRIEGSERVIAARGAKRAAARSTARR